MQKSGRKRKAMISRVERVFSIRRNEVGPASLLFFYLFLVIGGFYVGQSVGDALFLRQFPHHLPYAMIGSGLLSGPLVLVYIRLSHRLRLERLIIGMLLFFALSFTLFWWLTNLRVYWVYMLIYIWVQTEGVMAPTMGWTLANYILTTREARRVFGFIQMGAILGVPFFCFITADVMKHHRANPTTLILVLAALMGVCALLVKLVFRQAKQRLGVVTTAPAAGVGAPKSFRQSLRLIRHSRYLLLMTALIAIGCLVSAVLGYQFRLIARLNSGTDAAGLSAFFANFYGYMGLATFVTQLALTAPLLRAFGIRVTVFLLPIALLGPTTALLVAPTLFTAVILKGTHSLLRYSVDRSSVELLYLPVAAGVKSQVKSFLDTFVYRLADGTAGALLLLFANGMNFSPGQVSLVSLVLLFGWIAVAYGVRREYLNVLRRAIERRRLDPERTAASTLDLTTTEVLAETLAHGAEQQLLYGLSLFEIGRDPTSHPALRGLLDHSSPTVRQRALRLLGDAGDKRIRSRAETLLRDESPEVRTEALQYLVLHAACDPLSLLRSESDFTDYSLAGSVAAYLAKTGQPDHADTARVILQRMLSQTGPDAPRARTEAGWALGAIPSPCELHSELLKLLDDENPGVGEQALLSLGKLRGRQFLPLVIEKLGDVRLRGPARAALIEYGEHAVGTLQDYLNDDAVPLAVRKQIPNVLARIATPESAAVLAHHLILPDAGLRFDVLKALNKMCKRDPELLPRDADFADMFNVELMGYFRSAQILEALEPLASTLLPSGPSDSVLTRALRERMDYELERVFRLLALIYPPSDVYNAYVGVKSCRPQLRANALEVLEHLLKPEHYRVLSYALDTEIEHADRLNFAHRLCHTSVTSKVEALRILLRSDDRWLCACALHAIGELGLAELHDEVQRVPRQGDALLEETWKWANARLASAPTA